jgi:prenyltransferase beta subunit
MRVTSSSRTSRLVAVAAAVGLVALGVAQTGPADAATAKAKVTKTAVTAGRAVAGAKTTLTAKVTPTPSGGTAAFTSDGKALSGCTKVTVKSGKATCAATLAAGKRAVAVKYSGKSPTFAASTGKLSVTVVKATQSVVGGVGSCTTTKGALVAVDFAHWSGPIVRGCGTTLTTGRGLLTAGGFSITGTQRFPGFICRLGNALFSSGAQYPTSAQDACVNTPPATAYWSFWIAPKGATTWTYSPNSADSDVPANGEVEAWTFGATDISGTTGKPTFTPAQVRAGLPVGTAAATRKLALKPALTGSAPDLGPGGDYLIAQLTGGTHYEQFGFTDFGLTIDAALSLAATGSHDDALAAITNYVKQNQNDFTFLTGQFSDFASGGAVGKVALLAEVTGNDPRSFGGVDLIAGLDKLVCTKADTANQCVAKGNFAFSTSVFSQTLPILAQLRAGDTSGAAAPIAYLESLQTKSGGFPSLLPASGSSVEADSTAMAAMTLALVPGATARTAVAKALAWLATQQTSDGGFPGAAGTSVNSAALAIQALRLDAETYSSEIGSAEAFLAGAQNSDGGFDVAAGVDGSDLRASAQAVGGAVGTPFGSVLDDLNAKAAAADGADYLVSQLTTGDHYVSTSGSFTFDDQGLTSDGVFALLAAGGHQKTVDAMVQYLSTQVDAYADVSGAFGGPYSGSLAKLALVAEATGGDPHSFGQTDLLKLLVDHVCSAATTDGTCTAPGDFVSAFSVVSQALGVLALQASPVAADHLTASSPEVVRLHQLQCADGGFTSVLITPGSACTSDVDTTGYAVQALAAVPGTDAWLGAAQNYLEKTQKSSGLYPGAAGDNSNSTAYAAQALQSLVTALVTATVDPPGPKTVTPIVTWQSALHGLTGLAVTGGGFGLMSNATADLRASTQAVAAAAQHSLLQVSGAAIVSTPRMTVSGGGASGGSTGASSGSGASTSSAPVGSGEPIANTGVTTGTQVGWALLLLVAGGALAFAGRRRVALAIGRHRATHR